jgi:phosphate-selective porin OprO/OprP
MRRRSLVTLTWLAALNLALPQLAWGEGFEIGSKGLIYETPDERHSFRIGGRLHVDAYIYDEDVTPLDDKVQVRRLRGYLAGKLFDGDFRFVVDGDMSPERYGWRSVWGAYRGIDKTEFRLGNFVAPVGFEDLVSSNDLTFMERSLSSALSPGFLAGGVVGTWRRNWSVRVGGFGDPLGGSNIERRKSEGWSVAGRVTAAPWRKKRRLLHLGAALEWRDVDSGSPFRLRNRPESGGARRLVDTGNLLDVDTSLTFGFEAAMVYGPVTLSGEYLQANLERDLNPDPTFRGGYGQLAWFPTGERRRYSSRRAVFRSIEPKRKWGAVELALRYSALDLTDDGVIGGNEQNFSFGANWYLNKNLRLMFNFIQVDAERRNTLVTDRPRIYQFRLQGKL